MEQLKTFFFVLCAILAVGIIASSTGCATPCRGVIGAPYDPVTYQVIYTLPGSPAEAIGLQKGDELLYPWTLNGTPATGVVVRFIRGDKVHAVETTRACLDDLRAWK